MDAQDVQTLKDFGTLVAIGITVGGAVFGLTWKFVVLPHLKLHILDPLARVERRLDHELRTNGGYSLRDRVEVSVRNSDEAKVTAATALSHIKGLGDRLTWLEVRALSQQQQQPEFVEPPDQ